MKKKIDELASDFLKQAKEVVCPKCGTVFLTVEKDLTCYVCHTNIRHGAVIN